MSNNIGARDDSAATNTTDSWSVISILKGILSGISLKQGGTAVSSSNPLPVITKPEVVSTATGALGALNAAVTIAVTPEFKTASMFLTDGNLTGTLGMYYSVNNGANYWPLLGRQQDSSTANYEHFAVPPNIIGRAYEYPIPVGCTNLQMRCSAYTSGSSNGKITLSSTDKLRQSIVALDASQTKIGFVQAAGIQYTDTVAPLGISGVFISTTRDLTASTPAAAFASASTNAKSLSVCIVQDVAFTLQLLGSTDNFGSVIEVYRSITATLVGSNYVAEVDGHSCAWRYFQFKIVNGATAAARTRGVSKFLAN